MFGSKMLFCLYVQMREGDINNCCFLLKRMNEIIFDGARIAKHSVSAQCNSTVL